MFRSGQTAAAVRQGRWLRVERRQGVPIGSDGGRGESSTTDGARPARADRHLAPAATKTLNQVKINTHRPGKNAPQRRRAKAIALTSIGVKVNWWCPQESGRYVGKHRS